MLEKSTRDLYSLTRDLYSLIVEFAPLSWAPKKLTRDLSSLPFC